MCRPYRNLCWCSFDCTILPYFLGTQNHHCWKEPGDAFAMRICHLSSLCCFGSRRVAAHAPKKVSYFFHWDAIWGCQDRGCLKEHSVTLWVNKPKDWYLSSLWEGGTHQYMFIPSFSFFIIFLSCWALKASCATASQQVMLSNYVELMTRCWYCR